MDGMDGIDGMDVLHAPRNLLKVNEIYAYISFDSDGNEGVCAFMSGNTMLPMIAADPARLEQLEPIAKKLARLSPHPIELIKFSAREKVRQIEP